MFGDSNQLWGQYAQNNSTHAQNDEIQLDSVYLDAGTWVVDCIGVSSNARAIWTIRLDGSDVATADFYSSGVVYNKEVTSGSFVVGSAGLKVVSIKAASKNASSSDYYVTISFLRFRKIA